MPGKTAQRKPVRERYRRGWGRGWEQGYQLGRSSGYHLGRCDAVLRQLPDSPPGWWDIRVMYVTSGKGFPYSPLDESIITGMRGLVRELIVVNPTHNLTETAKRARPDLMLALDGLNLAVSKVDALRQLGIRTAVWLTDDPYYTDLTLPIVTHYDTVFTLELECVEFYRQHGCADVHYMPFASNAQIFRPKPVPAEYRSEVSFIGSAYWNRVALFDRVAPYLAGRHTYISGIWWDRLRHFHTLGSKIRLNKWMGAEETAAYYNGTKIAINLHRAVDDATYNNNSRLVGAVSPNPRTFEIAGCGTLLLTDVRSDLPRFYTPGLEIVTYGSPEELVHQIDYYLNREEERRTIALNALRRTMTEHTYPQRLAQMLRLLFG
ncbi:MULTISPECIES: CgeB family protein [Paenibacillus]|uniref:CgeB family protein n=1 Tax=Paenibacillus TaxID=44249 RepID=UPI0022B8B3D0|nr:glycosyltransferase [Paenibacillus caseinilyticus]MCZ8519168.1 glycosyltransferase [Paenibacillus caseinilyticus]